MTRAKEKLFFTSADNYGGKRKKKPPRFLIEMGLVKGLTPPTTDVFKDSTSGVKTSGVKGLILPSHFSFSQLAAFEKCPLQYKFAYILRVPVRGRAVFSFGKTVHNTLYQFLKLINEQKENSQNNLFANTTPDNKASTSGVELEDLIKIYKQKWIDEWYESQTQNKKTIN